MSAFDLFQVGVNDALLGRKPCVPSCAWSSDILVAHYMSGYNSVK